MEALDPALKPVHPDDQPDGPERLPRTGPAGRIMRADLSAILGVAVAHFVNDIYASFLAPLLPLVVTKFQLSLTLAGLLATIFNTTAAMSQPLFAIVGDRLQRRLLVVLGPTLTVVGMGLLGFAPSYGLLIIILLIAGTGTASFHPQGASTAGHASGQRKGIGMSLFVTGGELGYSVGPILIALVVSAYGLKGTGLAAVPGLAACGVLWWVVARRASLRLDPPGGLRADLRGALRPLALLWLVVVCRSIIILSYITFLPLLMRERGGSLVAGGAAIFLFGGVGALGGFLGGTLSDRLGRRRIVALSFLLSTPLLFIFIQSQGAWAYPFLALGGLSIYLSAAVTIVMGQELLPRQASVASSIVMGLAWGTAGLSLTGVGALADAVGLTPALTEVLALSLVALTALFLLSRRTPAQAM